MAHTDIHQESHGLAEPQYRLAYGLNDKPPLLSYLVHQQPKLLQWLCGFSRVRLRIVHCPAPLQKLAQAIADCGFHEFKRQLMYKAKKFGCEIILRYAFLVGKGKSLANARMLCA